MWLTPETQLDVHIVNLSKPKRPNFQWLRSIFKLDIITRQQLSNELVDLKYCQVSTDTCSRTVAKLS